MQAVWALAALVACGGRGSESPPPGTIVYVSESGGAPVVHRVGVDGKGDQTLRVCPGAGFTGPADPLGRAALVICALGDVEADHTEQLRLAPLDGGPAVELGPPSRMVRNPAWAPDGSFVVFESDIQSFRDIYRVSRDGTGVMRLTDNEQGNFEPSVDPKGRQIAFVSSRDGDAEVYVAGSDGTQPTRRTTTPGDDMRPVWSPDGQTLAFVSMRGGGQRVFLLSSSGGNARPLLPDGAEHHQDVSWSPDGTALVITVVPSPNVLEVWTVTPAGEVLAKFGETAKFSYASWSPDGAWLALSSDGPDGAEVVLATRDGRIRRGITSAPGADWLPRWLPPAR